MIPGSSSSGRGIIESGTVASRFEHSLLKRLPPIDYAYFQMVFGGLLQEAQAAGEVSGEEMTRFWNELSQADREQRLFGYVGFVVGGRKP